MDRLSYMCLPKFYSFRQLIQDVQQTDGQASKSQIRISFLICGELLLAAELRVISMLLTVSSIFSIIYLEEVILLCKRPDLPFHHSSTPVPKRRLSIFCHTEFRPLQNTRSHNNNVFSLRIEVMWIQALLRSCDCFILLFNLTLVWCLYHQIPFNYKLG